MALLSVVASPAEVGTAVIYSYSKQLPFNPDVPLVPLKPEVPLVPDVPLEPDDPELPELPEEPATPEVPDVLAPPEEPDVPDVPVPPVPPFTYLTCFDWGFKTRVRSSEEPVGIENRYKSSFMTLSCPEFCFFWVVYLLFSAM